MAQMPKGKPRSVPDPLGDQIEAVHRRERLKRERTEDAIARSESFSPTARLSGVRNGPRLSPTVTIGGQTYREVDNGRANVLVPVDDPLFTPAEREAQRRGIERTAFSATHSMGGTLDGMAAFLGAPQAWRDPILIGGAVLDTVATGLAPRGGATSATKLAPPPRQMPQRRVDLGPARFRRMTSAGQATGVNATVRKEMLGTGTDADRRITTPGLRDTKGTARAHLLANQLGGRGDIRANLMTATHNPTNNSFMKKFENGVAQMVRGGEFVDYFVKPIYGREALPPRFIMMTARGSNGSQAARIVENPAGRPR
jgi:hypothetical protein